MRIGIVGSGIAGLVSARLFMEAGHEVVIFEKSSILGLDAQSQEIEIDGQRVRADVPSRMFNAQQWPRLAKLYQALGVDVEEVDASQSFGVAGSNSFLRLDVAYRPKDWIGSLLRKDSRQFLIEAKRLKEQGSKDLKSGIEDSVTFGEYLSARNFTDAFRYQFLYPTLSSTVCTCSYGALDRYPARILLNGLENITSSALLKTRYGTQDVVRRLIRGCDEICTECAVRSVESTENGVSVEHDGNGSELFDHVIVATQANHVSKICPELSNQAKGWFGQIQYENVSVVVHQDASAMPPDTADWSTFNMISRPDSTAAMCSVWLNRYHHDWNIEESVFQTIMPIIELDPSKVISHSFFQRPVVTGDSFEMWKRLKGLQRDVGRRIWFCGSYAFEGIPLLETAVQSCEDVVESILNPSAALMN